MAAPCVTITDQLLPKRSVFMLVAIPVFFCTGPEVLEVVSAVPGKLDFEMEMCPEHMNPAGTMHGGLTATLVDVATTYALLSTEEARPGASLSLEINYLKAARVGERIRIEAEVLKQGRTVAFTKANVFNEKGDLIAIGNHVKHLGS